jgi:hypothetical protein
LDRKFILFIIATLLCFALKGQTNGQLSVSVTTSNAGGQYTPRHIVAVWVEDNSGNFVKTLMAYANDQIQFLQAWQTTTSASGETFNTTDAITGATRTQHTTRNCTWDGTDFNGNLTPDGTYRVCFELTDKNQAGNHSEFNFNKSSNPESLSPSDAPSFNSISIDWSPNTSIGIAEAANKLSIFPNPTDKNIQLNLENMTYGETQITVYNIIGGIVINKTIELPTSKIVIMDISSLRNGTYLIRVNNESGAKAYGQFIKQ